MALEPTSEEQPGAKTAGRILVACALRRETDSVRAVLPPSIDFLTTGIGSRQTSKVLARRLQRFPTSVLLFTGTAGQLDPSCPMGTVICPETWKIDDQGTSARVSEVLLGSLRTRGWEIAGSGLTVSLPVLRASSRLQLFQRTGAPICDMEAGAALQVADGTVLVRACEFHQNKPQIELGEAVRRAVISENIINGKLQVTNASSRTVIITNNAEQ